MRSPQKANPVLFCPWRFFDHNDAIMRGPSPERLAIMTRLNKGVGLRVVLTCGCRRTPIGELRAKLRFAGGMPDSHYILMDYTPVLDDYHPDAMGQEIDTWLTGQHARDYLVIADPYDKTDPLPADRIIRVTSSNNSLDDDLSMVILDRLKGST